MYMQFDILTIFPDLIYNYCDDSILGIAQKKELIKIRAHNWREFATDKHHTVDDTPYGGGAGMVLKVEPIYACLESLGVLRVSPPFKEGVGGRSRRKSEIKNLKSKIIILDPAGKKFDQKMAQKFAKLDRLVLISGRYQGFDERIYKFVDEKISVGDYVLSGGELPALSIVEATARLIPGVLGNAESLSGETNCHSERGLQADEESLSQLASRTEIHPPRVARHRDDNVCQHPLYTKPDNFLGLKVPKVLLSGDHGKIKEWREGKRLKIIPRLF